MYGLAIWRLDRWSAKITMKVVGRISVHLRAETDQWLTLVWRLNWKSSRLKLSLVRYAFKWCWCSENIFKSKLALWCFSPLFLLVYLDVSSYCCSVGRVVVHVVWSNHTPFSRTESPIKFFLTAILTSWVELRYSHSAQLPSLCPRVWFYVGLYLDV